MREKIRKIIQFITNPRLLLCFGLGWMITNGWSYIMFGLGVWLDIGWMKAVAGGYLAFLWLPVSPEKIVTVAISMALLRWLYPDDQKTLAVLKRMHRKFRRKRLEKKAERKGEITMYQELIEEFCQERGLDITLFGKMPGGYESAWGTYDVTVNTLFLNGALLKGAEEYEALYYIFHELRHGEQYLRPERFSREIQESRFYVVLYNGICFKLVDGAWRECRPEGTEEFFTRAYLSLPYERDANRFAYDQVREQLGVSEALDKLYAMWTPEKEMDGGELEALFRRIDAMQEECKV